MSFTNNTYDSCTAQDAVRKATGPGRYQLGTPASNCEPCFSPDPHTRVQTNGAAICRGEITDVDSELMGITHKKTNCTHSTGKAPSETCKTVLPKDCPQMKKTHSRMTNPPCMYKGIGYNRWEWLCENPQKYAMRPFQSQTNSRQMMRDNHRPCIKEPWEEAPKLDTDECSFNIDDVPNVNLGSHTALINDGKLPEDGYMPQSIQAPMISWQHCANIQQY